MLGSQKRSQEEEDKCALNADDVSRDLKDLVLDGLRETAIETAEHLFSDKPVNGVVDGFNRINDVGGFFSKSINKVDDYFKDAIEKESICRKEEEQKEPEMPKSEPESDPFAQPKTEARGTIFGWLKDSIATPILNELWKMTEAPTYIQSAPRDSDTGSLFMISAQLWKDTKNLSHCMDEQDAKHEAEMKEYVEKVKEAAKEKPWSEYTVLERHQARTKDQQGADYRQTNDKRHQKGQTVITWWEYEAMTLKNIDPLSPSGLNHVKNSVLCPHGRGGSGVSGGGSNDSGGGTDHDGSGNSNGGGGGSDLMNIDINCGGGWESNSDGTLSCKGP
jgi:uncharacterized membrane protein YgcG